MTLDLPTPPLPDAIATIAVDAGNEILDCGCGAADPAASELLHERLALLLRHGGQVDGDALHALERLDRRRHVAS